MSENTKTAVEVLKREAGNNPRLLQTLIEREEAAQEVANFGGRYNNPEAFDRFRHLQGEVTLHKELLGVEDPAPYPVETDN